MKKVFGPKFGSHRSKLDPKLSFFCHFLKLGVLVIFSIGQNDSLEHFLITSRGKTHKKNWEPKFGPNGPKMGPILDFLLLSSLIHQFSWKFDRMIVWNIIYIKPLKKFLGPQICSYLQEVSCQDNCSITLYISANTANKVK